MEIYNKENEYQRLQVNLDNKTQELKDSISEKLLRELAEMRRELVEIENSQSNIFDQTAENRAKNQTIMWWVLQLSNWREHEALDPKPFFKGKNYEEKLESYDEYEESDDDFMNEGIRKLAFFVSFWYMGRATSGEDFKAVEELYEQQNPIEKTDEEVEAEAAEAAAAALEEDLVEDVAEPTPKAKKKAGRPKKTAKKTAKKKAGRPKKKVDTETTEEVTAETASAETKRTEISAAKNTPVAETNEEVETEAEAEDE